MEKVFRFFILGFLPGLRCLPYHETHSGGDDVNFIGKGTNEIATALLQAFVTKEDNMAYSPFGYSAILAVFSEGARGRSREEISTALHFPKNPELVRLAYKHVLEGFVEKNPNSPEFKNWFYIYKNYSVSEELQNVLRNYYLTEVKTVERPEDLIDDGKNRRPAPDGNGSDERMAVGENGSSDGNGNPIRVSVQFRSSRAVEPENPANGSEGVDVKTGGDETSSSGSATNGMNADEVDESTDEKEEKKDVQRESVVDRTPQEGLEKKKTDEVVEPGKTTTPEKKKPPKVGPMPIDHLSGMTDSSIKIKGKETEPQMIIFNGLYYKGEWATPFEKKPADSSRVFYKSENEKIFVPTIQSQGLFNAGAIPTLDCSAIELPYKGGRYSLLILVPNSRNGLTRLISDLSGYPLAEIYDQMTEKMVDVSVPCFEINTISKPISSLRQLGTSQIHAIFDPNVADLSGISPISSGLYVEELVQMVTFKVEAEYSKANFLTASIAASRSNVQNFQVNQPFLFYLRDRHEDLTIVNGKVIDPTPKPAFYFS